MKENKKLLKNLRIGLGICVFGVGLVLLLGDNPYADSYKWYQMICAIFNTVMILGIGLWLLDTKD